MVAVVGIIKNSDNSTFMDFYSSIMYNNKE